jgi:hypothetical protein
MPHEPEIDDLLVGAEEDAATIATLTAQLAECTAGRLAAEKGLGEVTEGLEGGAADEIAELKHQLERAGLLLEQCTCGAKKPRAAEGRQGPPRAAKKPRAG